MGQSDASISAPNGEDLLVLIAGSDPDADAICSALGARGADVQQLSASLAVEVIVASPPDVVLLVGDAAKQRGALIRSQLVRRMRGADINLVVLIDGPSTLSPNNPVRMLSRTRGADAVAADLIAFAHASSLSSSRGTLDEVANMVTRALERPSEPAPRPSQSTAPSHIVMKSATKSPPSVVSPVARQTIRVAGAIPAPARIAPSAPPPTNTKQLSLAPPTSLQALAARRIEITRVNNPPPLPESTEVSLADVKIETDRISGDIKIERVGVPPLPTTATASRAVSPASSAPELTKRDTPTPGAWTIEPEIAAVVTNQRFSRARMQWAGALALAACSGLIAWNVLGDRLRSANAIDATLTAAASSVEGLSPTSEHGATVGKDNTIQTGHSGRRSAETTNELEDMTLLAARVDDSSDDEDPVGDDPDLVRARQLCNEGHALRSRGRLGLAEAKYLQALGLFPQYPRAIAGVVRVHLTRGDGAEAVRWAERLTAMQPNRSNNQLLLGDAYALSGKGNDARHHWRKSAAYGNSVARKRLTNDEPMLAKPKR